MTEAVSLFREGVEALEGAGGKDVRLCYQCSLCTASCPLNSVRTFMLRKMLRQAQFGLVELESEDWWRCVTCGLCTSRCPRGVPIIDVMRSVRRILVESGMTPPGLHAAMNSMASLGNPWLQEREKRPDWGSDLGIKRFSPGTEVLYFVCCTAAYDPRARGIARSTATLLQKAGVDFGILGAAEVCCGESARRAGNEALFQSLAGSNVRLFNETGVKTIVTNSPHCYFTFKNEYGDLGGRYEVVHSSQYLARLLSERRLKLKQGGHLKVAYHDPCYLGRHSGVYEEPRSVLRSIPGVDLVELPESRNTSLCCGGGGGRMWLETPKGERFSDIRLEQAGKAGVDVLATACPYCFLNLDASAEGDIKVKDLSELVAEALQD